MSLLARLFGKGKAASPTRSERAAPRASDAPASQWGRTDFQETKTPLSPRMVGTGVIVFAHANGFPAGCYHQMLEYWRNAGWIVLAPDLLAHDPAYPVTDGWEHLRDELIEFINQQVPGVPVVLVGHSMGGYLCLMAASLRSELARAVVLLDTPLVHGHRANTVKWLKRLRLIGRSGAGKVAAHQREQWPTWSAARAFFGSKDKFASWNHNCFEDYMRHGFEPNGRGGVRLAFRREIEAAVHNTVPHDIEQRIKAQPLRCPLGSINGTRSREAHQLGTQLTRRLSARYWRWMEGTHLFPLERPVDTAKVVLRMLG